MLKKVKFSKLAVVMFLTILVWVWADLALDENRPIYHATIIIGRTKPNQWVTFSRGNSMLDVNEIVLRGPASKINNTEQLININPQKLEFPLVIDQFRIEKPGTYTLSVEDIINKSGWIKQLGLSIKSCDPCEVSINVVSLSEQELDVQCYDDKGLTINLETPQKIRMYVPEDWRKTASVVLSEDDIQRAIKQPIEKKPYIVLPTGVPKYADKAVEIKLSQQIKLLGQQKVQNAKIGYCLSENLQKGQCKIEVENMPDILNIEILTTPDAKVAYESQWVQVELEIHDDDIVTTQKDGIVRREVYYRLPEDYVRLNQIKLAKDKVTARFKVTSISPAEIK